MPRAGAANGRLSSPLPAPFSGGPDRSRTVPSPPVIADKSSPMRRSIEVEYWVIDDEGRLTTPGALVDASPGAEREFVAPMLEIKTTPCTTTAELRDELLNRIRDVLLRADDLNKGLVPLGTSLTRDTISELSSDRTRIQNQVFGPSFQYVRHCAGTHIHFEQQPGHAIDQLNTLIALDPALALVNSARHFRGEPLAAGARSELYRRRAYEHCPRQGRLWSYVTDRADWTRRLDDCYARFLSRAEAQGADRSRVESCFDPEGASWIPVKLRPTFGTVEWRSPDTALPTQVLRLADTMAALLERIPTTPVSIAEQHGRVTDQELSLPSFETVSAHVDRAIKDGRASDRVRAYLRRMGFDVDAYTPIVERIDSGPLTNRDARRLRLAYADRLREDVLTRPPATTN